MRKITQIVFTITLLFSLIACGNDQNNDNDPTTITTNITIQVAQETTWTPFSEATDFYERKRISKRTFYSCRS